MTKPTVYYGFCPWGHAGVVTIKTAIAPEHQRNHCVHCGTGLIMGATEAEVFTMRNGRSYESHQQR